MYYDRDGRGYSEKWVRMSKASMRTVIPNFNAQRMVDDYVNHFYTRANNHRKALSASGHEPAHELSAWKRKIAEVWPKVTMRRVDDSHTRILAGESLPIRIAANLAGLTPDDVIVECVVGSENKQREFTPYEHFIFDAIGDNDKGETLFSINLKPTLPGKQLYKLRMYPSHRLLANRFEAGYMIWI
jgi:starch phosphorylase